MNLKYQDFYEQMLYKRKRFIGKGDSKKCTAIWWKVFVMVGVVLLISGVCCVLYGYLSPIKSKAITFNQEDGTESLSRRALVQNKELDTYKLVGLICFCIGGLTMAVALMIPSFLYRYMEDEDDDLTFEEQRHFVKEFNASDECQHADSKIPLNRHLSEVQPLRIAGDEDADDEFRVN